MAKVTIRGNSGKGLSGLAVRARKTGGYGSEESCTDSSGMAVFSDTANRVQIEVHIGSRWRAIGDVLRSLRGEVTVVYDGFRERYKNPSVTEGFFHVKSTL